MVARLGEIAALGTSVSWTVAALIMERAVGRIGVMATNTLKVAFASVYLALFNLAVAGSVFPAGLPASAWVFLGLSALVGFVVGDYFLLHAYEWIGSRLSMLFMALSVPFTALGSFVLFGESLSRWALAGMALCVGGIALTVAAGDRGAGSGSARGMRALFAGNSFARGSAYAILSAVAMAGATLLTKRGAAGVSAAPATQARILCAFIGFVAFAFATGKAGEICLAFRSKKSVVLVASAAVFGPFIGVGCLLFAVQHAEAGVASTLSSLSPVLIIPPSIVLFKRKVRPLEIVGSVLAVVGLSLFFV